MTPSSERIVLCIDDAEGALAIRKLFLETAGYSVLTAVTGSAGLALLRATRVDVLVLDYRMPEMDGEQVAEIVKREQPELPIIVLSGYIGDLPAGLLERAVAVVPKGSDPTRLLNALTTALGCEPARPPKDSGEKVDRIRRYDSLVQDHLSRSGKHLESSHKALEAKSGNSCPTQDREKRH